MTDDEKISVDECVQTDLTIFDIHDMDECIQTSGKELEELKQEVDSLRTNIMAANSIEAYGEAPCSIEQKKSSHINSSYLSSCIEEEVENCLEKLPESEDCLNCVKIRDTSEKIKDAYQKVVKVVDDLQTQLIVSEKKRKSNEQFLERQTVERENEREESDRKINSLMERLKEKDKEVTQKNKLEAEVLQLELQVKELTECLEISKVTKDSVETRLKVSETKISQLREVNQDLESRLAAVSVQAEHLDVKLRGKEAELQELHIEYNNLLQQLDSWSEGNVNQLEQFNETHATSTTLVDQMKTELMEIERAVIVRTKKLEAGYVMTPTNLINSPLTDISVCEQIQLIGSEELDSSSSPPSRASVSINLLTCLNEKLHKLFSAEDAAFKKIRDQDMELLKLNKTLSCLEIEVKGLNKTIEELNSERENLELERNCLSESLKSANDQLTVMKVRMDDWQYKTQTSQSDLHLKQLEKIRSLESQIEHYKNYLTRRDWTECELTKIIKDLKDYISNSVVASSEKSEKTDAIVGKLQSELSGLREGRKTLRKVLEGFGNSDDLGEYTSSVSILPQSSSSDQSSKNTFKEQHTSSADNVDALMGADMSRRAATVEISSMPMISPFASPRPLLMSSDHTESSSSPSFSNLKKKKLDLNLHFPIKIKDPSCDSININSDALTSTKNYVNGVTSSSAFDEGSRESQIYDLHEKVERMTDLYEKERRNCSKLKQYSNVTRHENRCLKENETTLQKKKQVLEDELKTAQNQISVYEEDCHKYDEQIRSLTEKLRVSNNIIDELKNNSNIVLPEIKELDESQELKLELEKRCIEYQRQVDELQKALATEMCKISKLSEELQKAKDDGARIQETVKGLEHDLEKANQDLRSERAKVDELQKFKDMNLISSRKKLGSLRDLTEKVQNEVKIAGELDQNIFKKFESSSSSSSSLQNVLQITPNLNENVQNTLLKILREGYETLTSEENRILVENLNLHNPGTFKQLEEKDKKISSLLKDVDAQKLLTLQLRAEIKNFEEIQSYHDERLTRYVSKIDDYRKKNNKLEIEVTSERCKTMQVENQFKKEISCLKDNEKKLREEFKAQNANFLAANIKLQEEVQKLTNQLEFQNAELGSRRTNVDSKSSAESELNKYLSPLKEKLTLEQSRYTQLKSEFEKVRNDLLITRSNLRMAQMSNEKLDVRYQECLNEKIDVQKKLSEVKLELETLSWQNQRVIDKLKAAEVSDMKMRKLMNSKEVSMRAETQSSKESQKQLEQECEMLRINYSKLSDQFAILKSSWEKLSLEFREIFCRCLRAESYRRSLSYQKNCFVRDSYNSLLNKKTLYFYNPQFLKQFNNGHLVLEKTSRSRFKAAAVCIIVIRRVKTLIVMRREESISIMVEHLTFKLPNVKIYPYFEFNLNELLPGNGSRTKSDASTAQIPNEILDNCIPSTESKDLSKANADTVFSIYESFRRLKKMYD